MCPFVLNLFLLKLKTENWKHYSKIIFKCMNSIVRPVNSILTVSEQYINSIFCPCIVKSRDIIVHVQEKKKKKPDNAKCGHYNPNGYIK